MIKQRLDDVGEFLLIYEGMVLLGRRVHPHPFPPISEVVWRLDERSRGFYVVPCSILGWLAWHFFSVRSNREPALPRR